MSLSPTNEWHEACSRADADLRYLITITDGVSTWKALDGPCDSISQPIGVESVAPVGFGLDPFTREPKSGAVEIIVEDNWLRPILVANQLKHQKCTITIGAREVAEGNFLSVFSGPIEEIQPQGGRFVSLMVEDVFTVLRKTEIVGYFVGHPLAIIEDILSNKVGLAAALIDSTSLDPTQYSGIGHLVFARGVGLSDFQVNTGVTEPTPAFDVITSLCRMLNGQLVPDETGKLSFQLFDASAAAVDTWQEGDILPGSFEQDGVEGKIVNRIVCDFGNDVAGTYRQTYQADDTASQSAQAYPGMSDRILSEVIESDWLDYNGTLQVALTTGVTTAYINGPMWAWAGSRKQVGVAQDTNADCTAGRPVYLMLVGSGQEPEIIKATSIAFVGAGGTTGADDVYALDPEDQQLDSLGRYHIQGTYTVARAQLGTSSPASWGTDYANTVIYDITALVLLCDELLARFVGELYIVKCKTLFGKYAVQIGDLIKLVHTKFLANGFDGITASDKWEAINKIVDKEAGVIEWTFAHAGTDSLTRVGAGKGSGPMAMAANHMDRNIYQAASIVISVSNGFGFTDDGGRNGTIGAGDIGGPRGFNSFSPAAIALTFTASVTTWVGWDTRRNQLVRYEQAAEPTWLASEAPIRKVICDAGDITSTADLRVTTAIDGVRLHDTTVDTLQIAPDAVTNVEVLDDTLGLSNFNREQEWSESINVNSALGLYTRG